MTTLTDYRVRMFLLGILLVQILTLQFVLPMSAHSGQTAIPWMMNQGMALFDTILEQHAPATSIIAAFTNQISPFDTATNARILNTIVMVAISICIFSLSRHYSNDDDRAGLIGVIVWFLLGPVFANVLFYFNTLLICFVLLGLIAWTKYQQSRKLYFVIVVGILFGLSTLAKQQGWAVVATFGLYLLLTRNQWRTIVIYSVSALFFPLMLILFYVMQGVFDSYIYWNWIYNLSGYMDSVPLTGEFFRKLLLANILVPAFFFLRWQQSKAEFSLFLLIYLALLTPMYPRFGETAAITIMPLVAIMSGCVIIKVANAFTVDTSELSETTKGAQAIFAGVGLSIALGWLWMGSVIYIPTQVHTPGYDEFAPIVAVLDNYSAEGDTLFVLPETDSTPQLHPLSDMLPPRTWIKGWRWYLEPAGIVDSLLSEWEEMPPVFVVLFPDLEANAQPAISPLVELVEENYIILGEIEHIPFHGPAIIYTLSSNIEN